jgi:hypothetical protein
VQTYTVLVNELYETKFLGMFGEFSMERSSPRKDQILSLWVILMQNSVSFISLIV